MAVVAGLRELPAPARVCIHIDSSYVMDAFDQGWLERWQRNGWLTSGRTPVKNRDLWKELFTEVERHQVDWAKVPGHTGVELNERADELACAQRDAHARRSASDPKVSIHSRLLCARSGSPRRARTAICRVALFNAPASRY